MNEEEVKKYIGKKVLIVLKNNFRYTAIIPPFSEKVFSIIDKYGYSATIDCDSIGLITESCNFQKR